MQWWQCGSFQPKRINGRWIFGDAVCELEDFVSISRCVLNSSYHGFTGIQPVHTNRQDEPLQESLFTAQILSLAELRVAFSRFLSPNGSSDKLEHI